MTFMPDFKTKDELLDHQLQGLRWTVNHAYNGSPIYRKRLDEAGVGPDGVRSLDDIVKLPFTTARDLQEGYPFPLPAVKGFYDDRKTPHFGNSLFKIDPVTRIS